MTMPCRASPSHWQYQCVTNLAIVHKQSHTGCPCVGMSPCITILLVKWLSHNSRRATATKMSATAHTKPATASTGPTTVRAAPTTPSHTGTRHTRESQLTHGTSCHVIRAGENGTYQAPIQLSESLHHLSWLADGHKVKLGQMCDIQQSAVENCKRIGNRPQKPT